ncbi:hypothetical protein SAMN04487948_11616 [Halogranum amylolyticum]|uniref:Short C-terminal domain-containing protein n=1 Tax=Halogranum amylolyticum TaxID=660520 RepID=A0A1H8VFQ3_9EURY|nr:hypothetical protein [Halogranum amylolyticum]SEP13698.1 hypothetical protein SAMN04487948_11616 [Halogranum amylolyticum]
MSTFRTRIHVTESLALLLCIVATFAFALFLVLEWQLLDLSRGITPYYFGVTFIVWALMLLFIGYWYQARRQSHEQRLMEELQFAYARGDLTTEEYQERQKQLQKKTSR